MSPEVLKWVSDKASRDSQIFREQGKAAEERALLKNPEK